MSDTNWLDEAKAKAREMFEEFHDQMIEQIIETGKASDDLYNDYSRGDEYHHESNVDRSYSLTEAAAVLDELKDYEETDGGLWEGLDPRKAIEAQAAYTFGNAVYSLWRDLVKELNDEVEAIEFETDEQRAIVMNWWLPARFLLDDLADNDLGGMVEGIRTQHAFGDWSGFGPAADWLREHPENTAAYMLPRFEKVIELAENAAKEAAALVATEAEDEDE